jgi:hypothetical protein
LEKRWNEALEELQRLKDDYQKHRQQQGFELTGQQKAELLALAEDLPRLWRAQTTSAKDRKRMLRLLIKDVTVEKRRSERKVFLHIRWQGGALEDLSVDLPLPMPERLRYSETILTQVRTLASSARTDQQIAAALNQRFDGVALLEHGEAVPPVQEVHVDERERDRSRWVRFTAARRQERRDPASGRGRSLLRLLGGACECGEVRVRLEGCSVRAVQRQLA